MTPGRRSFLVFAAALAGAGWTRADDPPVRVTIVVVLASADHDKVDPKLAALAQEVKKKKETEKLTGFKLEATLQQSITVGESHTFKLVDGKTMKVTVASAKNKAGRIGLTVDAPGLGEIEYTCVCDKFVPVITPHVTKKGEQLLVAILAKPCTGK
jgi:hypothetical protein